MKSTVFKIAYVIYIVICLLYSQNIVFASVSVRHIMTIIMFLLCIRSQGFRLDVFLKCFLIYLFFYALSNIVTGHLPELLMKLAGTYLAAIVIYMSTKIIVQQYDGSGWVVSTLLVIAILNALVTIFQFYGNPLALSITDVLRIENLDEKTWETYERFDTLHGRAVGGLVGAVNNGYFLSAASVLALYNKNNKIKILNWILCVFLFFALFLVQERAGLFSAAICLVLFVIISSFEKKSIVSIVVFFIIALLLVIYGSRFMSVEEMRYSTEGFDVGGRSTFSARGWDFVKDYPLGGEIEFHTLGIMDPHNVFTNSYIFGGLFGGTIVFLIILFQLFIILKISIESFVYKTHNNLLLTFSLLYLTYTMNSFFHNPSLPAGSPMFFVLWGMVASLRENEMIDDVVET